MRFCQTCNKALSRRANERLSRFAIRKYCGHSCYRATPGASKTSVHNRAAKHLKKYCEACGGNRWLHAHHCDSNRMNNAAENIQTLCYDCHMQHHARQRAAGISPAGKAAPKTGILPTLRRLKRKILIKLTGLRAG